MRIALPNWCSHERANIPHHEFTWKSRKRKNHERNFHEITPEAVRCSIFFSLSFIASYIVLNAVDSRPVLHVLCGKKKVACTTDCTCVSRLIRENFKYELDTARLVNWKHILKCRAEGERGELRCAGRTGNSYPFFEWHRTQPKCSAPYLSYH